MIQKRIIEVLTTSKTLDSALDYTFDPQKQFKLCSVEMHFSSAITKTATITRDANAGSNYDTVLETTALNSATDHVFRPNGECVFIKGDKLKVECEASAGITVYVQIYYQEI